MKKVFLTMLAVGTLLFAMSSCGGEKLLTEEEMAQQIEERSTIQIDSIFEILDAECEERFDELVNTMRDSILTAAIEEEPEGGK